MASAAAAPAPAAPPAASPVTPPDALGGESLPVQVAEADGGEVAVLHVSREVLQAIDYFAVLLSDRWPHCSEALSVRLPPGCSLGAARRLFLRLYAPPSSARFDWGSPDLEQLLQLALLADMFMLGPAIVDELRTLLRAAVRTGEATERLRHFCICLEVPPWLSRLAGFPGNSTAGAAGGGGGAGGGDEGPADVAAAVEPAQIRELAAAVCGAGDVSATRALRGLLVRRSALSAPHALEVAEILRDVLRGKAHLLEEETVRGSIYKATEGCGAFLGVLASFARACPMHLPSVARALYFPLAGEHLAVHRLGSCAAAQYRDATSRLLAVASAAGELPELLGVISDSGHVEALEGAPAFAEALASAEETVQVEAARVLGNIMKQLGALGSIRTLRSLINAAMPQVSEDAQMELCGAVCGLSPDLRHQLLTEPLLRAASPAAQLALCGALARLGDARRVRAAATAGMLAALGGGARRLLCAALVTQISGLEPEVQRIVLAELGAEEEEEDEDRDGGRTDEEECTDGHAEPRSSVAVGEAPARGAEPRRFSKGPPRRASDASAPAVAAAAAAAASAVGPRPTVLRGAIAAAAAALLAAATLTAAGRRAGPARALARGG